jgi:hypothetical protein
VVKEVKCGIAKVGDQYFKKTAQGQFCGVELHDSVFSDGVGVRL